MASAPSTCLQRPPALRIPSHRHTPAPCRRPLLCTAAENSRQQLPGAARRAALLAAAVGAASALHVQGAVAFGLGDLQLPGSPAAAYDATVLSNAQKLENAEQKFQSSDLLKSLKERSATNAAKNRTAIQNKYCYRQAELGIGDCGGLRYVPGATKSGKQKTPAWLGKLLGAKSADDMEYESVRDVIITPSGIVQAGKGAAGAAAGAAADAAGAAARAVTGSK